MQLVACLHLCFVYLYLASHCFSKHVHHTIHHLYKVAAYFLTYQSSSGLSFYSEKSSLYKMIWQFQFL